MTFQEVKDKLRVLYSMTITKRDGEFRVNFAGGKEETACYTNDLDDAFSTGVDMRLRATENKKRIADRIDGYDRDDLGESPDY
jgi:hypothetical protein